MTDFKFQAATLPWASSPRRPDCVSSSWSDQEAQVRPWRPGLGVCSHQGVPSCPGGPAVLPLVAGVHSGGSWAQGAWAAGHQQTGSFLSPRRRVGGLLLLLTGGAQVSRVRTSPVVSSSRVWARPPAQGTWRAPDGGGGVAPALPPRPPPPGLMPAPSKGSPCSAASSCLLSWIRLWARFTEIDGIGCSSLV